MTQGSNGGPPADVPLTAKTKLECIKSIIERVDLTSPQKCIGVGIVLSADREWTAEVKTASLQQFASAKDRETVFRATKALDQKAIIAKASVKGQSGKYTVMPPSVVEAIIEAYDELQSSRVKADGISGRHERDKSGVLPTGHAVGFEPTSPVEPVGFEPTGQKKVSPTPPSKKNSSLSYVEQVDRSVPQGYLPRSADERARAAFEQGQKIHQKTATKSARAQSRIKGELDGSQGIEFTDGKLSVMNGVAAKLAEDFPGIDLNAVCDRAGPEIAKFGHPTATDAMSVLRKWARIIFDEMSKQLGGNKKSKAQAEQDMLKAQNEALRRELGYATEVPNG